MVRSNAQDLPLAPSSISIQGEVIDNYANISYEIFFDNSASDTDKEISWFFALQNDMRLSNISLALGEELYWGRIMIEQDAIDTYNDSVATNQTAILVTSYQEGYSISFNILKETQATLTVFTEGLLSRKFGLYSLELPVSNSQYSINLSLDLSIRSNFESIAGIAISGISGYLVTDLSDGISISYSATSVSLNSNPKLTY
ncbi:MAG: VIT domain-containing protein, partial [Candidatus Kariarchaeaceae archaeon]